MNTSQWTMLGLVLILAGSPTLGKRISWPYPKNGNTDERLSKNVDVKYFNKKNINLGQTWKKGGQKISFTGSQLSLEDESKFIPNIETVFMSHGYHSSAEGKHSCETFVQIYNKAGRDLQVICIDWRNLADMSQSSLSKSWSNFLNYGAYNGEAMNSVDVGWWMGRLLASLVKKKGLDITKVHLIGHSLGAHVVGMMGRTFTSISGKKVARVTGLDPAGPSFVQNDYGLKKHMIGQDSATFVDIIHTDGGFNPDGSDTQLGALQALGHADFYPNGGTYQGSSGCSYFSYGTCSHSRSIVYYLHSILGGATSFPAYPCASAHTCSEGTKTSTEVANHLGEFATKPKGGGQKQYYLDITGDLGDDDGFWG